MLQLKPNCECCDRDLAPESDARICSFECTFCTTCADQVFGGVCPNCGGNLVARPVRPASKLANNPASTERYLRAAPCGSRVARCRIDAKVPAKTKLIKRNRIGE